VFSNTNLKNTRETKNVCADTLCNADIMHTKLFGDLKGYVLIWNFKHTLFGKCQNIHEVTYDILDGNQIVV